MKEIKTVPTMRTVKGAAEEIRRLDPQTPITEYVIRQMVNDGSIPILKVGSKSLLNFDKLLAKLNADDYNDNAICVSQP